MPTIMPDAIDFDIVDAMYGFEWPPVTDRQFAKRWTLALDSKKMRIEGYTVLMPTNHHCGGWLKRI
jgi:hypothetical protein